MKRILTILTIAAVWPALFVAGQTKQDSGSVQGISPGTEVNWLDAPTPDGSPTLRETSDWLGKTLSLYGSGQSWSGFLDHADQVTSASIDNNCNLNLAIDYAANTNQNAARRVKHPHFSHELDEITIPLGAGVMVSSQGDHHPTRLWIDIQMPRQSIQIVPRAVNADDFSVNSDNGYITILRPVTPGPPGNPVYAADFQIDIRTQTPPPAQTLNAEIPAMPGEMAPRIVNAIQHAAALCRSTYKPSAQTKDTF
jgi:hypothetical protein